MTLTLALLAILQPISDADRLREAMPALELQSDARLTAIFRPYFDCYLEQLRADARANLSEDTRTGAMFQDAASACAAQRDEARAKATTHLNGSVSTATLETYQRVAGWQKLSVFFAERGKGETFNAYLARMYRGRVPSSQVK